MCYFTLFQLKSIIEAVMSHSNNTILENWNNEWQDLNTLQENLNPIFHVFGSSVGIPNEMSGIFNVAHWATLIKEFEDGNIGAALKL